MLPIRTTRDDLTRVAKYLANKPTGATIDETKKVIGAKFVDGRKVTAYREWGLITQGDGKLVLTPAGREFAKATDNGAPLLPQLRQSAPYASVIEREYHQRAGTVSTTDVAAYWHDSFKTDVSDNDQILNDQAVCFFHFAEAVGLGTLVMGRKGAPTRFEFDAAAVSAFVEEGGGPVTELGDPLPQIEPDSPVAPAAPGDESSGSPATTSSPPSKEVQLFVAHGTNKKPLEQLKKILDEFGLKYVVAVEEPNAGRPISKKVEELMRSSTGGIFIFTGDDEFRDLEGKPVFRPRENVIYELGAASLLYERGIIILKEEGVTLPTDFSDIGHIPFEKDKLDAKMMDVFKELRAFGMVRIVPGR